MHVAYVFVDDDDYELRPFVAYVEIDAQAKMRLNEVFNDLINESETVINKIFEH